MLSFVRAFEKPDDMTSIIKEIESMIFEDLLDYIKQANSSISQYRMNENRLQCSRSRGRDYQKDLSLKGYQ